MNYQRYTPHPLLAPYVQCYWSVESMDTCVNPSKERIFPDGCTELIFHYGELFTKSAFPDVSIVQPRSFIHGQIKGFMEISATGKVGIFSVRFHPDGLSAFARHDLQDITGANIDVKDFWGGDGDVLADRILNAACNRQRISLVEQFLFRRLSGFGQAAGAVAHCVQAISLSNGNVNIDGLAAKLNVGRRHLERKFASNVGLSPKLLARIVRFQHILTLIEHRRFDKLTTLAYEGGFYDQAHFIKDFKIFTGLNPKQYFSENLALAKFFSLT